MTLSDQDRAHATEKVSPFTAQSGLDDDLPNVIWNMLKELADRPMVPDGVNLGRRTIYELCDQRPIGPVTLDIEQRLLAELSEYPFEARYNEGLGADDLNQIIDRPECSFPAVELAIEMYDPDGYDIQPAGRGTARQLRVLVLAVNHESVLYYDPLRYGKVNRDQISGIETSEIDKQAFVKAWKGRSETTSTLWVEETEQSRLMEFN
ncbi:hypothetical protein [Haloarchaeobius sp. DFWS5]|uniref:hypothetical protein n=1 Tax=Haloarchaeobius sp. DFWS5 TaxID=3446114 RepID=UPI003EB9ACA6